MTAIAYKAGVLAADSAIWVGSVIVGHQRKIARKETRNGVVLLAGGGDPAAVEWFLANGVRLLQPRGRPSMPKITDAGFRGLFVQAAERGGYQMTTVNEYGRLAVITCPFYAGGVVSDFLTGMLVAGAGAEQAVKSAITWTDGAGGEVHVEKLGR